VNGIYNNNLKKNNSKIKKIKNNNIHCVHFQKSSNLPKGWEACQTPRQSNQTF